MSQWAPCPALWCFWRSDLSSRSKSFPSLCLSMFITFSLHKLIQSVLCMITVKFYGYSKDIIWTSLLAQLIKNPPTNAGDSVSIPGSGRSPGEGNGTPLQYSCLENSMGQRSLLGYSPWDHKESDTTKHTHSTHITIFNPLGVILGLRVVTQQSTTTQ